MSERGGVGWGAVWWDGALRLWDPMLSRSRQIRIELRCGYNRHPRGVGELLLQGVFCSVDKVTFAKQLIVGTGFPLENPAVRADIRTKLLWIKSKAQMYSPMTYIQYPVVNCHGREYEKRMYSYMCISESVCCAAELNTAF